MAAAGAGAILAARSEKELKVRAPKSESAVRLDVCDPQSIAACVEAVGAPDILVNVAGQVIAVDGG
jgi:NADP-dependent 3-hydroxy acid dehydrogenase YdfG